MPCIKHEAHGSGVFAECSNVTPAEVDIQTKTCCRGNAIGDDACSFVDLNVRLGKVDRSIAERDDSSGSVGIELVKEWELRIAYDSSGLLGAVLKAHHAHQEIEHSELEIGTA